jgi:hypothetical protein
MPGVTAQGKLVLWAGRPFSGSLSWVSGTDAIRRFQMPESRRSHPAPLGAMATSQRSFRRLTALGSRSGASGPESPLARPEWSALIWRTGRVPRGTETSRWATIAAWMTRKGV